MRLAFCFLIKNDINHIEMWEDFFKNAKPERYRIYIHKSEANKPCSSNFVSQHLINQTVLTEWGGDLYSAIKLLYKKAYDDLCTKYILLSESTIPVRSFSTIYKKLSKFPNKSSINYLQKIPKNVNEKNTHITSLQRFINNSNRCSLFAYNIDITHWYYADMWTILTREHVNLILNDETIMSYFENAFAWDENYPMYVLSFFNELDNIKREKTTFVNWKEPVYHNDHSKSPKEYTLVTSEDIDYIKNKSSVLFARKFSKDSNIKCFLTYK